MNKAETKEKGDIGLTQVIAHLRLQGIHTALPLSEHLPFDLIAIDSNARLARVSIKYRKATESVIEVPLRTISSNAKGYKIKSANLSEIDAFAIYCPDTGKCYYVRSELLEGYTAGMSLSIAKPEDMRCKDKTRFNWASDFEKAEAVFWRWTDLSKDLEGSGRSPERS